MRFALAMHGSRGDVEPCAAVGVELQRRGHDVRIAVPPNLVGFVESAGLTAAPYGPNSQELIDDDFVHNYWKMQPLNFVRAFKEYVSRGWAEMSATLTSLADGADVVLTGTIYQGVAANVAEYYDVPLAALHYFPSRANGHLVPMVPAPVTRSAISAVWWLYWRMTKDADDSQRRELGLPQTASSLSRRLTERQALEIQAYDELCFPGLAAEWGGRWPFVGALSLQLPTPADDEVATWIAAGTAPIYFGFGSMPVRSAADTVAMISAVCAELGERALICSGWADFDGPPTSDHVKVVRQVNHAAVFPRCRAVVHHGGAGTTAAGMRAGVPTLILWITSDQPIWAAQVKQLNVGVGRSFSRASSRTLAADLRRILAPSYAHRAKEVAARMTSCDASVRAAADLLEEARLRPAKAAG
ncbi:UDP:flavonoid glycosyltransferase YjiC (YdhE family) [Mycobacterium sp. OAS707]|uniref:glycosyltransferase n=1 Tax=Mycobacterium sp. OAS707 TaxID=2663822 RepID=UPI001788F06A|nr:glycosyltransferase [Mycobacterium sp. OAS707]MBE1552849.1 UDP:flavonoid glycosyltransferase YjiC (YdhE family) [Mycobacterium sp. OAS707]